MHNMARITISMPDETGAKAEIRATSQKRSVSSYISLLVEQDLRSVGMLADGPADHGPLLAKLTAALKAQPALAEEVQQFLKRATRRRRAAA